MPALDEPVPSQPEASLKNALPTHFSQPRRWRGVENHRLMTHRRVGNIAHLTYLKARLATGAPFDLLGAPQPSVAAFRARSASRNCQASRKPGNSFTRWIIARNR